MGDDRFADVDRYIDALFAPSDEALDAALKSAADGGLPEIQVSPGQGKLLYLFARIVGARRILEIGTLGGYSAIWLARALPADGRLVSLELDPHHADVARANLARAGLSERAEVRVGPALETLGVLAGENTAPFDLVFIDADKTAYPDYLDASLPLIRKGGLLLADNVVREGRILDQNANEAARAVDVFNKKLAAEPRVEALILQQVGIRGHDGLAVARVRD